MTYAPLWVKTCHSFLGGGSFPGELVERAAAHGIETMAVTDRDGVYGLVRTLMAGREHGVRIVTGAEVSVAPPGSVLPRPPPRSGLRARPMPSGPAPLRLVLLARTRAGYAALCRLLSAGHARCAKGRSVVSVDEVAHAAGGLVALCPERSLLHRLRDAFGADLYALCPRHHIAGEREEEKRLREAARRLGLGAVGAVEVLYHDRSRRPLTDVLACIRAGRTLATAGTAFPANAEHELRSPAAMAALFEDAPDLLRASLEIAERCTFDPSRIRYRYPAEPPPDGRSESSWLRELTLRGAALRYPDGVPDDVTAQLERELALIAELGYGGYFLTMHEIVEYCRAMDILCQGRGSAANSAVCFCLGITAVDPVRMDLLFERFLSRERAEPPDIDLDIEHDRREEVIQHVYHRYGRRHAAMVANVIRYRARSAVREVGKVLGFPQTDIEAIARLLGHHGLDAELLRAAGVDPDTPAARQLLWLGNEVQDFPRHLSIHPGGFLLGHEPVDTLVPIEPATMEDRTVIQWDKYDVDDIGLFKVDLLGLGALTAVHLSFDLMREHEGVCLDMATVPAEDAETYDMVSEGDTVGVFQIESRAQMAMLPRLRPRTFYDLVIEVAIVRPGPIQGDMVHPYLRRRNGEEPVELPHPSLGRVLSRTLGVPIFQEQVMKLAVLAADYTPGEADQLRRDMAAWRRSGRIEGHHERLVSRMVDHGIPEEFAERVFSQIRGFGEYGFPESHAASFALLAYVTAWLKRHHPAAFLCAMLNAQPMGFYSASSLVEDGRRHGIEVRPIDVNAGRWDCTLEPGPGGAPAVRMGLRYVKGLGERHREVLDSLERPVDSLSTFVARTGFGRRALTALAEAGAFDSLAVERRDALWELRGLAERSADSLPLGVAQSRAVFRALTPFERIGWDYRASSHSTRGHPMEAFREALGRVGVPLASEVNHMPDGRRLTYAGMVITRQRPGTASGVTFFTLEDETGFVNVVVWRHVFERYATIARTASLLAVTGRLQVADGVTHLIAERLWIPALAGAPHPRPPSRDFH